MSEYQNHIERHQLLHDHLDEIIADFLANNRGATLGGTNLMMLINWSYRQTLQVDHKINHDWVTITGEENEEK